MSLQIICTTCNVQLTLRDDQESTLLTCPKCGGRVKITHPKPEPRPKLVQPASPPPGSNS